MIKVAEVIFVSPVVIWVSYLVAGDIIGTYSVTMSNFKDMNNLGPGIT